MSRRITAATAKARFADCLRDVSRGEEIVITRYGAEVAAIVSVDELQQLRRLRAATCDGGLIGVVGRYDDAEPMVDALDAIVAGRSTGRVLEVPGSQSM